MSEEEQDGEAEFPVTVDDMNNKMERRRLQLFEDMQQFYDDGSASSEESDENSIFSRPTITSLDQSIQHKISSEEESKKIEMTPDV